MSILLEDDIKNAVLAMRWKRSGDGLHPDYFVNALPESLQLEGSAASFLAHFIADHITTSRDMHQRDLVKEGLDKYSLEVIASYLEDQGYTVSSPD
jgi:hypothetical protein